MRSEQTKLLQLALRNSLNNVAHVTLNSVHDTRLKKSKQKEIMEKVDSLRDLVTSLTDDDVKQPHKQTGK